MLVGQKLTNFVPCLKSSAFPESFLRLQSKTAYNNSQLQQHQEVLSIFLLVTMQDLINFISFNFNTGLLSPRILEGEMCLDLTDWKLSLPFPFVDCSQPIFVRQFLIYQIPLIIRLQYLIINSYSNVKKTVNCDDYLTWAFWKNLICFFAKLGKESHTVEFIGSIY